MSGMWDSPRYTNLVLQEKRLPDCFSATIGETLFDFPNSSSNALDCMLLTMCALQAPLFAAAANCENTKREEVKVS